VVAKADDPAFLLLVVVSAFFVFYKVQIVPQHFWMARRFVAVIMPAALLFAAAAVFTGMSGSLAGAGQGFLDFVEARADVLEFRQRRAGL